MDNQKNQEWSRPL
jgi:hypothetical protein